MSSPKIATYKIHPFEVDGLIVDPYVDKSGKLLNTKDKRVLLGFKKHLKPIVESYRKARAIDEKEAHESAQELGKLGRSSLNLVASTTQSGAETGLAGGGLAGAQELGALGFAVGVGVVALGVAGATAAIGWELSKFALNELVTVRDPNTIPEIVCKEDPLRYKAARMRATVMANEEKRALEEERPSRHKRGSKLVAQHHLVIA